MNNKKILQERNLLLTKLIWFSLALAIIVDIANKIPMKTIMTLVVAGLLINSIITFMVWKEKMIVFIKYIISVALGVFSFLMLSASTGTTSFVNILIIYFSLAIISLYHDYKPIIVSAIVGLFLTNYSFFNYHDTLFPGVPEKALISLNLYLVLISVLLIAQSIIGRNMQKDLEKNRVNALATKDEMEKILIHVKNTVQSLSSFSSELKDNITVTGEISADITTAFTEITGTVDSETKSVNMISESISDLEKGVQLLADVSSSMNNVSGQTAEITQQGNNEVEELSQKMANLVKFINNVAQLMDELGQKTDLISEILSTINNIVKQTNLLALNAAIEAARAGGDGKGFAVVAEEVRQLASNSQEAIEKVAGILQGIREKTRVIADEIVSGQEEVKNSTGVSKNVESRFLNISNNANQVVDEANRVESMVKEFHQSINSITEEVQSIASSTEENTASSEEVLASIEDQDKRINEIVDNFQQLDDLTQGLKGLTESKI